MTTLQALNKNEKIWKQLFPGFQKETTMEDWDLNILCHVIMTCSNIQHVIQDIKQLKNLRNELYHLGKTNIEIKRYERHVENIEVVVQRCCGFINNNDFTLEMEALLNHFKKGQIVTNVEDLREFQHWYETELVFELHLKVDRLSEEHNKLFDKMDEMTNLLKLYGVKGVILPDTNVEIIVKNCNKDKESEICQLLLKLLNSKIEKERPEEDTVKILQAVKEAMSELLSCGREVTDVYQACVNLVIKCPTFENMRDLWMDCMTGKMTRVFKTVEKYIRELTECPALELEVGITQFEVYRVFEDTVMAIEETLRPDTADVKTDQKKVLNEITDAFIADDERRTGEGTRVVLRVQPTTFSQAKKMWEACNSGRFNNKLEKLSQAVQQVYGCEDLRITGRMEEASPYKDIFRKKIKYTDRKAIAQRTDNEEDEDVHMEDNNDIVYKQKVTSVCNVCDRYYNVSVRLYEILDWIGASDKMRDKYREEAIVWEITITMMYNFFDTNIRETYYIFGSQCEGTTTQGLNSDRDILCCSDIPVVERISDAPKHGLSFLMVADETTKPGYIKLQCVDNKVALYNTDTITRTQIETDIYDRICLLNVDQYYSMYPSTNGPAVTRTGVNGESDVDFVKAHRCQHIPSFAKSWLKRVNRCNRLNDTQLHMLKGSGCFFVGKNHPSSENGPIEWRPSFFLQERELMASLNSTQHKCYILLKIIKKDIIHKRVPGSISSYHCKTCVLYAIETTPCEFWFRRNLLECTRLCIKLLLHWVKEQYCPNYFIPDENMFDRLEFRTLRQVQGVLENIVEHWCSFIWSLTCDDIGNVLYETMFGRGPSFMRSTHTNVYKKAILKYFQIFRDLGRLISHSLKRCKSISALPFLSELGSMQTYFLNTECVDYHTEKESRQAISYVMPHLHIQIAQCVASIMLTNSDPDHLEMLFNNFKYYIEKGKDCDVISANLIVASYCLQSDRYDVCGSILLKCETSLKSHVLSVCTCSTSSPIYRDEAVNELIWLFRSQDIPYREFVRTCTAGCLTFLPHQANIVPLALHYEMYRSVHTPPGSRDDENEFWFDWMVVDSSVYLYFLQYVLYSKTNKPVYKKDAINNLIHIINTKLNIGHKKTAINLLGWMFKEEHETQRAMECFLASWRIGPIHNAAIWHALVLIHSTNRRDLDNHAVKCFTMNKYT